jgi:histidinol-phosphate aminotransferase
MCYVLPAAVEEITLTMRVKPRDAVERLPGEYGIREGRAGMLRLDYNENTVGCSPAVRRAVARMTRAELATYPECGAARERLAPFFKVRADEMALTNGADEALRVIFDAYAERGDRVLLVEPTFPMYRIYARLFAARTEVLRYDAEMRFPLREVLAALRRRPRIFFLANPNNPTGTLVPKADLARILRAARHTLVVVDEAYSEFSGVTVLPWIRRFRNLVVVRTFSKAAGLAGLRLGVLLAERRTAAALRKPQPPFPVNVAALAAAEAATHDHAYIRKYVREVHHARREFCASLERLGIPCWPSPANFVLADLGARAPAVLRALERQGILLRDRRPDFPRPGYVRVTIGTPAQMRRVVRALQSSL